MIYTFQNASFRDQQTGLYSEAYFMEVFYREWHRLIRDENPLSILVIHPHMNLSESNELHSYTLLGQLLNNCTKRTTDLVSRFNDNEFIIGLFDASPEGTKTIIERIIADIENDTSGLINQAKDLFISAINIYPSQTLDISGVLHEVSSIYKPNLVVPDNAIANDRYQLKAYALH